MVRKIKDFIRYTAAELENYTKCKNSCVKKINKRLHINFPPYGLGSFKSTLLKIISDKKIGSYDNELNGIILDIRNIKVLGNVGAIRFDNPSIHLNVQADCYVFQPKIGSVVQGLVKHISQRQIGVIIYRVFSVPIRLSDFVDKSSLSLNSEIEFRIKNFDLQNTMPYIEGELMAKEITITKNKQSIKFEDDDELEYNEDNLFKEPNTVPLKTEIHADSENEEIVFSELSYLNDVEAKRLKEPRIKKIKNSESCNSTSMNVENVNDVSLKSALKKSVKFENSSDDSSSDSDNIFQNSRRSTSSNLKISEHNKIKSLGSPCRENEASDKDYLTPNNTVKFEKTVSVLSLDSDNKYSENSENVLTNSKKKFEKLSDNDTSNIDNKYQIKKEIQDSEDSGSEDVKNEIETDTDSNGSDIDQTSCIGQSSNNVKNEPESEEITQPSPDIDNLIKTEFTTPIKNNQEYIRDIKIETPIKMNGYESEDLFEYSESQISASQSSSKNITESKRKKKDRKAYFAEEINNIIEKSLAKRKITNLLPAHSTQKLQPESSDKSSNKSSDSSFNEAFKDILNKAKKEKIESENEILDLNHTNYENDYNKSITKNKSKNKNRKTNLDSSMAEILKRTLESKINTETLSQELENNTETSKVHSSSKKSEEIKHSRKRKISLNESMDEIVAKMIQKKTIKGTTDTPARKKKKKN